MAPSRIAIGGFDRPHRIAKIANSANSAKIEKKPGH
jgi:hypothetical protein